MLHGLFYWGGSRSKLRSKTGLAGPKHHGSARNLAFFNVKWLQPAMKSTSCVRQVRLRSFHVRIVPPMCFARVVVSACVVLCGF